MKAADLEALILARAATPRLRGELIARVAPAARDVARHRIGLAIDVLVADGRLAAEGALLRRAEVVTVTTPTPAWVPPAVLPPHPLRLGVAPAPDVEPPAPDPAAAPGPHAAAAPAGETSPVPPGEERAQPQPGDHAAVRAEVARDPGVDHGAGGSSRCARAEAAGSGAPGGGGLDEEGIPLGVVAERVAAGDPGEPASRVAPGPSFRGAAGRRRGQLVSLVREHPGLRACEYARLVGCALHPASIALARALDRGLVRAEGRYVNRRYYPVDTVDAQPASGEAGRTALARAGAPEPGPTGARQPEPGGASPSPAPHAPPARRPAAPHVPESSPPRPARRGRVDQAQAVGSGRARELAERIVALTIRRDELEAELRAAVEALREEVHRG